ncbi:hypothetical protein F511_30279 [Dorcoceras hygrometricum]|uniref:Uncharacterized protein n=1 Tax=Dorcoceras hygrometricum TaxID=472368 RepID=A0A2Z7BMF1_9LAMI|nr:hypothetical protein F511_30279 [Dorcoceras hygrometricum]
MLTGTLYPPPGAPPAGSKPRPAEKTGKPENNTQATNTSPRGTSGQIPVRRAAINSIRKTDKYANAMQGIKATTESREPKDLNNSSTARSDQRNNNQFVTTGILSTWELPTHLQYTIPDANNQLHLLLLTHEMWELPTPFIAANKPGREIEVRELPARLQGAKSNAYANRLHKEDVFAHLTSFKQTIENNNQTKRLSKRSPTLPLSLSSELPTVGKRIR